MRDESRITIRDKQVAFLRFDRQRRDEAPRLHAIGHDNARRAQALAIRERDRLGADADRFRARAHADSSCS